MDPGPLPQVAVHHKPKEPNLTRTTQSPGLDHKAGTAGPNALELKYIFSGVPCFTNPET